MKMRYNRIADRWMGYMLIGMLLPVARLLGLLLQRNHNLSHKPSQIVFIKLMGLGSLVTAIDPVRSLKQQFPETKFILITDANIGNGIVPFDVYDEIWTVRTDRIFSTIAGAIKGLFLLWRAGLTWVIDLEVHSKLTTVYSLLTLARNRFGFFLGSVYFRRHLNTHNVSFNREMSMEENYYRIAEAVGNEITRTPLLSVRLHESEKPFVLLNNTCSELSGMRKMPAHILVEVCEWLLRNSNYKLAFSGTKEDAQDIEKLIEGNFLLLADRKRILNLAGKYDFNAYYRFMVDKTAFLISIDSAPLHIAKQLGLPTVSIWGPTDPAQHLSVRSGEENRHVYFYRQTPCSPCIHQYSQLPCNGDNQCMKRITSRDVIVKIEQMLVLLEQESFSRYKSRSL